MIPALRTERLLLRGLRASDLDAYAAMHADAEVMRYLEDGHTLDRAAAWRMMAVHLGHWQLRGYGQGALEERSSGQIVGRAGLWEPEGWPGFEVGWLLARPRWGQGFATEAGRAAIDYAFSVLGAEKMISLIRPENRQSVHVAERLGESYERTIELQSKRVAVYCAYQRRGRWRTSEWAVKDSNLQPRD